MCGIAGALAFAGGGFAVDEAFVTRMREAMPHRGPDGAETWVSDDARVGLGFRRLAIIDLSPAAMQPMPNEDGSIRLVFNGEIYNHAEIRAELEALGGHRWRTDHADGEVIVHAFEEWGIDCLRRFRGMFALALWDGRSGELWLARDRIGIKPLYWAVHRGRLVFASEIKALLTDPQLERAVDEESLYHYLSFLTAPAPRTLFRGVSKLPGGSWLRAGLDGDIRVERWWDAWDEVQPLEGRTDAELAALLLDELRTSVRYRKVSDVPVGVFLSGGIDSSTNAMLFSEGEERPVQTFSIGYDADYASYPNELEWAKLAADAAGAAYHERILSLDDALAFLPEMVRLQDEPIADPVCVPLYYVSELARAEGVVVAHAGEGADELFHGYPRWKAMLGLERANALPVPRLAKRLGLAALGAARVGASWHAEYLRRGTEGLPVFWGGAEAFTEASKAQLLSSRLRADLDGLSSWDALLPIRERFDAAAWEPSALNWMTYLDLNLRLPELLLMRVDKMSMGVGLEARVPFLDHRVVGLALSMPTAAKTRGGELKHVLKLAVRGVLPDVLVDRPKQGFRMPVDEWFGERLGDHTRRELDAFCRETDLLDRTAVAERLERPGRDAWYLLNLALWWREWMT
jgi:asparagine synthase (glutamine-hydrolysing)